MGSPATRRKWDHFKRDVQVFWYSHSTLRKTIKRTFKLIVCPICWPCMLCASCCTRRCIPKSVEESRRIEGKLTDISRSRREERVQCRERELSAGREGSNRVKDQSRSPLFARLPAELRLKIYQAVLCATGQVHLHFSGDPSDKMAVTSITCLEPDKASRKHPQCSELRMSRAKRPKKMKKRGTLNLLLTCRKIYQEAIDTLYSSNNLIFANQYTLETFSKYVLEQRLQAIRFITIECWPVSDDERVFDNVPFRLGVEFLARHSHYVLNALPNLKKCLLRLYFNDYRRGLHFSLPEQCDFEESLHPFRNKESQCEFWLFLETHAHEEDASSLNSNAEESSKRLLFGRYPIGEEFRIG